MRRSIAAILAAATDGASVLENKYGRAFCRRMSTTSFRPVVYPPVAPPRALPSVELMMSTCEQIVQGPLRATSSE